MRKDQLNTQNGLNMFKLNKSLINNKTMIKRKS